MCADVISTGGGAFSPEQRHIYFLAVNTGHQDNKGKTGKVFGENLLIAVNELKNANDVEALGRWIGQGKNMFLDSGIFNLAMQHVRAHGVTHNEALNLPPEEIDGFADLFEKYVSVVRDFAPSLWGYIELDQGGRENKIRTRARLEAMGLNPIPVYHPLADGWEYFDYLAQRYDRICLGNIVQANRATRLRLLATIHQRKRAYPHLWVHALGLTPNELSYTLAPESADSSSWLSSVRWSGYNERTCGAPLGGLPREFQYELGNSESHRKGTNMGAYGAVLGMENWRAYQQAYDTLEQP